MLHISCFTNTHASCPAWSDKSYECACFCHKAQIVAPLGPQCSADYVFHDEATAEAFMVAWKGAMVPSHAGRVERRGRAVELFGGQVEWFKIAAAFYAHGSNDAAWPVKDRK